MSRKRKKGRSKANSKIQKPKKVIVEKQSPLMEEVTNITNKVHEEELALYELDKKKRKITEDLVDKILLNDELTSLISQYCYTSKELDNRSASQENRKRDLEFKQSKLTEENKTVLAEVTEYMQIGDDVNGKPVGLYNSTCKAPVAICLQKNVYLSYGDVKFKKCLQHRDHKPCKHLQWLTGDNIVFK